MRPLGRTRVLDRRRRLAALAFFEANQEPPMADQHDEAKPLKPATEVIHRGRDPSANHGFVNPPAYRGSTVLFPTVAELKAYRAPFTYGRRGTPTTKALEEAIAKIEGGAATILTASGYQAVTTAILGFAEAGDHILMVDSVYQPTRKFCDMMLKKLGVETEYYDPLIGRGIAELFRPNTRLVFTESPGSQTFEVQDIPAIAAAAHARGIWVLMDNTWASPLLFKPFEHGVDVSIQAATKYIVGHADAMLGAVTATARALPFVNKAKETLGVCPGSRGDLAGLARATHTRGQVGPASSLRHRHRRMAREPA